MAGALAVAALILSLCAAPCDRTAVDARVCSPRSRWSGCCGSPRTTVRDDALPALAVVLAALGLAMVARLSPELAQRQQLWMLVSLVLAIALGPAFTQLSALRGVQVSLGRCVARALRAAARLRSGGQRRAALDQARADSVRADRADQALHRVLFGGVSRRDGRRDRATRGRGRCAPIVKYLGPLFIGWGASMAILVLQRDLGMATLLLATFATMLFVATRRARHRALRRTAFRARRVLGRASLSVRAHAHRRVAQSVLRSVRRRLSIVAGVLLARGRRPVRKRIPARPSRIHPGRVRPTTSMPPLPRSSA